MSQLFEELVGIVRAVRADVEKAEEGNKAASARVRKAMQQVKSVAQEIRRQMLELRDGGGDSAEAEETAMERRVDMVWCSKHNHWVTPPCSFE